MASVVDDAGLAVVAVLEALHAVRVVDEDGVGPVAADGAHDVAEELARVLEPAVRIAQHHDVLTPMKSAAARCSSARLPPARPGVSERSAVPAPPLVQST